MKPLFLFFTLFLTFVGLFAFGGDINETVTTEGFLLQVLTFATTLKGLTTAAIAAGVAQLVVVLGKTPLANVAGKWRLVLVSLVSVVALVLASVATGQPVEAALAASPALASVQVFVHQLWKQLFTEAGNVVPAQNPIQL